MIEVGIIGGVVNDVQPDRKLLKILFDEYIWNSSL
jgi:hypothetical protein